MKNQLTVLLALFLLFVPVSLQASLQVFPTRILITDQKRAGQIALRHVGDRAQEYQITAVFYRMMPDGRMLLVQDPSPDEKSATKMLRFSPRRITLPPNIEQVIRVMAVLPGGVENGEYRAHLYFEGVDDEIPKAAPNLDDTGNGLKMRLDAKVAIAVPVIIRHGKTESKITLANLHQTKEGDHYSYSVDMSQSGNSFAYGDLYLLFKPLQGPIQQIALTKGVSSYINKRMVSYPFSPPDDLKLSNGILRLEFRKPLEEGGKIQDGIELKIP